MSRKPSVRLLPFLLLGVFLLVAVRRTRSHAEAASHQRFGRYTEQQIIEMSRPIAESVIASGDPLYFTAERHDELMRREWCIDAIDRRNHCMAHLVRDADTGQHHSSEEGAKICCMFCAPWSTRIISSSVSVVR